MFALIISLLPSFALIASLLLVFALISSGLLLVALISFLMLMFAYLPFIVLVSFFVCSCFLTFAFIVVGAGLSRFAFFCARLLISAFACFLLPPFLVILFFFFRSPSSLLFVLDQYITPPLSSVSIDALSFSLVFVCALVPIPSLVLARLPADQISIAREAGK